MRLLAAIILTANAAFAAAQEPWPYQRANQAGTASVSWQGSADSGTLREWHYSSRAGKTYRKGVAIWASPALAIVNGEPMVFIGGCDNTLHALNLSKKEKAWSKITNGAITDAPVIGMVDGRTVVFWTSLDRFLYAYLADTGERLWTRELFPPTNTQGIPVMCSPLIHKGIIYAVSFVFDKAMDTNSQKAMLTALEMDTGRVLWQKQIGIGPMNSPSGCMVNGKFVLLVPFRKGLLQSFTVSASGCEPGWSFQMPHEVVSSPSVMEDEDSPLVYLGSRFGDLIAIRASDGKVKWKHMTGNWIDNNVSVGEAGGNKLVFAGSNDYSLYAFDAITGELKWRRPVGGEIFSAPAVFRSDGVTAVCVAALDNHLYIMNALDGHVITTFFTGTPIWDKIAKGDVIWGSPAALESPGGSVIVHGSYNGSVYVLPVEGDCSLRTKAQKSSTLWKGLGIAAGLFLFIILPPVLLIPQRQYNA